MIIIIFQIIGRVEHEELGTTPREYRRSLNRTDRYTRKVLNDPMSLIQMEEDGSGYSRNGLVSIIRNNGHLWTEVFKYF